MEEKRNRKEEVQDAINMLDEYMTSCVSEPIIDYIEQLERENQIKDEYLSLIVGYGFDYNGYYGDMKSMAGLIDKMVDLAKKALINDDKSVMYTDFDETKKWNILHEEILNNEKV